MQLCHIDGEDEAYLSSGNSKAWSRTILPPRPSWMCHARVVMRKLEDCCALFDGRNFESRTALEVCKASVDEI